MMRSAKRRASRSQKERLSSITGKKAEEKRSTVKIAAADFDAVTKAVRERTVAAKKPKNSAEERLKRMSDEFFARRASIEMVMEEMARMAPEAQAAFLDKLLAGLAKKIQEAGDPQSLGHQEKQLYNILMDRETFGEQAEENMARLSELLGES